MQEKTVDDVCPFNDIQAIQLMTELKVGRLLV